MSLPKVNVGGQHVKAALTAAQAASVQLQAYTQTVLGTPDIQLPSAIDKLSKSTVVADLPKHQATARANATFYLDHVNPTLVQRSSDIIGFGNLWNAEYARLLSLANDIHSGSNKATFQQGIANLLTQVKAKQGDTVAAITSLNDFLPKITSDSRALKADDQHVTLALGGAKGEIAQLKKRINADNAAISKDIAIIAGGATADIVGGLMIVVGLLAEIETAGASTALVVGGLLVVGAGTTAMGIAGKNLSDTKADLATANHNLAVDQLCLTSTQQASKTLGNMEGAVNQGISAVTGLQKGWATLQSDFTQVTSQLGSADPSLGSWLVSTLQAANTDWADTLKLARNLQQFGTLPVKKAKPSNARAQVLAASY